MRRGVRTRVVAALVLLVAAGTVWHATLVEARRTSTVGAPPPPAGRQGQPLRRPPQVSITAAPYAFAQRQPDTRRPVTYDPCRPVHYVVRRDGAPTVGDRLIQDAIAEVSAATGLVFADDGTTTEAPSDTRRAYQPDR
jgi:hypothetical protein